MSEAGFVTGSEIALKRSRIEDGRDGNTGYRPDPKKRTRKKKEEMADDVELGQVFQRLPGEVAIALSLAFKKLQFEVFETNTELRGPMGMSMSIPFAKATTGYGNEKVTLGWGTYIVTGLGNVQVASTNDDLHGTLTCTLLRSGANTDMWDDLLKAVNEELPTVDIFRGTPFRVDSSHDLINPRYLDISASIPLILNDDVEAKLDVALWRVIKHWKLLEGKVRRKRGIIMTGSYGTGKTLTALHTAKLSVASGLSFFTTVANMATKALEVARLVSPCVLFLEDLDQATHGNRDRLNDFLNTLSGIETKNTDVILIVSTNFVDRIDPAFLRPERLDTIVEMSPPDAKTVGRIIRAYAGNYLNGADITEVSEYLASPPASTPAIVSEVVNLSKIKAITDGKEIDVKDLMEYAVGMMKQRHLANPQFIEDNNATKLHGTLTSLVHDAARM